MPGPISLTPPAVQHAAPALEIEPPVAAPDAVIPAHGAPVAPAAQARSRMAALLCLPADPIARRARLANTAFVTGSVILGGGAVTAFLPAIRTLAVGTEKLSDVESGLELGAAVALTTAGIVITGIALAMTCTTNTVQDGEVIPQTVPPSPAPVVGAGGGDAAPPTTPAGATAASAGTASPASAAAVHDIETPAPRIHRLTAGAQSAGESPAQQG